MPGEPGRIAPAETQIIPFWRSIIFHSYDKIAHQIDASFCQVVRAVFFLAREVVFLGRDRRVGAGPGVAWPKSWRSGVSRPRWRQSRSPVALPEVSPADAECSRVAETGTGPAVGAQVSACTPGELPAVAPLR